MPVWLMTWMLICGDVPTPSARTPRLPPEVRTSGMTASGPASPMIPPRAKGVSLSKPNSVGSLTILLEYEEMPAPDRIFPCALGVAPATMESARLLNLMFVDQSENRLLSPLPNAPARGPVMFARTVSRIRSEIMEFTMSENDSFPVEANATIASSMLEKALVVRFSKPCARLVASEKYSCVARYAPAHASRLFCIFWSRNHSSASSRVMPTFRIRLSACSERSWSTYS